ESTDETIAATARLSEAFGLNATLIPRWGELQLLSTTGMSELVSVVRADPTGVDMDRVVSTRRAIDELRAGEITPPVALEKIRTISNAAPAPTWLFTLAAAAGAAALSIIFGVQHFTAVLLIAGSAALGAILRRTLGDYSSNTFVQPFCAALLAG